MIIEQDKTNFVYVNNQWDGKKGTVEITLINRHGETIKIVGKSAEHINVEVKQ